MAKVIRATVAFEGCFYSPNKNPSAPIRIYSDRWIEDDIAASFTGSRRRNRLSRKEFHQVCRAARDNRRAGRV